MINSLTKTDFVNAFICPTKLNYIQDPEQYTDSSEEDEYLQSLSDGGYQVGKLAQLGFKDGIEISENTNDAIVQTELELKQTNIVLFEGAIQHNNFLIRVDILRKKENVIDLIEVKAKSYDSAKFDDQIFYNQDGTVNSKWKEYFYDLAFQHYVVKSKFPECTIRSFFQLPNKNIDSKVDNLFSKFSIKNKKAYFLGSDEDLIDNFISEINVTEKIEEILSQTFEFQHQEMLFYEIANELANAKVNSINLPVKIGSYCKHCQFVDADDQKSGMYKCWKTLSTYTDKKFKDQKVIDIYSLRSQKIIDQQKYFIDELEPEDLKIESEPVLSDKPFSSKDRQYLQCFGIQTYANKEDYVSQSKYLDYEINKWKYPLNFIDFETATHAIPAYKGLPPYGNIAFQYSIHTLDEDGVVKHESEFLSASKDKFPNLGFIKNLYADLSKNEGSIFMWSNHETKILNDIKKQILKLKLADEYKQELEFIDSLMPSGKREIIDQLKIAKGGVFYPNIKGSNSIKKILPAVIRHSIFVQQKYSQPIYGSSTGIPSKNYQNIQWVQKDNIDYRDPYDIIKDLSDDAINQGGMAATTFAKLLFEDLTDAHRLSLQNALLKYCELDTLAMVMIAESWINKI